MGWELEWEEWREGRSKEAMDKKAERRAITELCLEIYNVASQHVREGRESLEGLLEAMLEWRNLRSIELMYGRVTNHIDELVRDDKAHKYRIAELEAKVRGLEAALDSQANAFHHARETDLRTVQELQAQLRRHESRRWWRWLGIEWAVRRTEKHEDPTHHGVFQ